MKKIIALLFFLLAAAAVFYVSFSPSVKKNANKPKVTNFEECAAAGYPVMQSYPEQCTAPGGGFFIKQVVPER